MNKPEMPKKIFEQVAEHSSCFILLWFDREGLPCVSANFPQVKDKMALMQFLAEYLHSDGIPPEGIDEEENGGKNDDGEEPWR